MDAGLAEVSAAAWEDEAACVAALLERTQRFAARAADAERRAKHFIETLRREKKFSGIEAFQQEYGLDSHEGILLMCLAEALLRIPDKDTADALIHDKLTTGEWDKHLGLGRPWLLNAGTVGLELAERVTAARSANAFVGGLIHRLGEPLVRAALKQAMKLMGGVFVLGENIASAQKEAARWHKQGSLMSYDMLGEGARSAAQAASYFESYLHAINALPASGGAMYQRDGISIKLTALHPRVELRQWERLQTELLPRLKQLIAAAAARGVMVTMDAEEATRLDVSLLIFAALLKDPEFSNYPGLGLAVQAYQKRAVAVIGYLQQLAAETGKRIPVRLVKGAYWDSEIKRAQMDGLEAYPVFTRKAHTDLSYLACAEALLARPENFYPQFATHNAHTVAAILETAGDAEYEFQRLHGMGEALYGIALKETPRRCRIYAPVGPSKQLLSYLIRRILENGANSSFVQGLADKDMPVATLIADPLQAAQASKGAPHERIPLPLHLYPDRENSRGVDLGNAAHLMRLQEVLRQETKAADAPKETAPTDCDAAFVRAEQVFATWRMTTVEQRAQCLERIAALYEEHREELIALCVHEAGKTLGDAIAEVREAADFCRYYAKEARRIFQPALLSGPTGERNTLTLHPRGTFVAISPWNFPLAIFTGQVAAALVTGNCVLAKPAEQTPRIAARAVGIMHAAGVPKDALQLLCGSGEIIGQKLVGDPRTAGVVFTGSTTTAWAIHRALAARDALIAPLIAETGGQNCMVIDSSALLEQTVDDMVISAFGSAGQRCSALRVAFVQEDIADELLEILAGAIEQLRVGDPADIATDIGPVIDEAAYRMLTAHIAAMRQSAKYIAAAALPADAAARRLVAPHAFEIASLDVLKGEVFGPILHVIRYRAHALEDVIRAINATGYGLTFGIQSRIDERIRYVSERVNAGNIYVNRSMIGAVVGVQPFGGEGLSGTGPKAGGPHYLPRFCIERTVSFNTTAVGGNLELLV